MRPVGTKTYVRHIRKQKYLYHRVSVKPSFEQCRLMFLVDRRITFRLRTRNLASGCTAPHPLDNTDIIMDTTSPTVWTHPRCERSLFCLARRLVKRPASWRLLQPLPWRQWDDDVGAFFRFRAATWPIMRLMFPLGADCDRDMCRRCNRLQGYLFSQSYMRIYSTAAEVEWIIKLYSFRTYTEHVSQIGSWPKSDRFNRPVGADLTLVHR